MSSCCPESEKMFWVKYKQESAPRRPCSGWTRAVRCSLSVVRGKLCFSVHHNIHNMRPLPSAAAGKVYLVYFSFKPFIFWHKIATGHWHCKIGVNQKNYFYQRVSEGINWADLDLLMQKDLCVSNGARWCNIYGQSLPGRWCCCLYWLTHMDNLGALERCEPWLQQQHVTLCKTKRIRWKNLVVILCCWCGISFHLWRKSPCHKSIFIRIHKDLRQRSQIWQ